MQHLAVKTDSGCTIFLYFLHYILIVWKSPKNVSFFKFPPFFKSDLSNNTAKMDQASKMDLNIEIDLNIKMDLNPKMEPK